MTDLSRGMKQQQGEKREAFLNRVRAAQREAISNQATLMSKAAKRRKKHFQESYEDRLDNLGLSQD